MTHLSRRSLIKSSLLTLGGTALLPHIGLAESPATEVKLDNTGRIIHSPFFREYLPEKSLTPPQLRAKLNAN